MYFGGLLQNRRHGLQMFMKYRLTSGAEIAIGLRVAISCQEDGRTLPCCQRCSRNGQTQISSDDAAHRE
jgi:hypothetical protein